MPKVKDIIRSFRRHDKGAVVGGTRHSFLREAKTLSNSAGNLRPHGRPRHWNKWLTHCNPLRAKQS